MKPYYNYTREEFQKASKIPISIEKDNEVIFKLLASEIIKTIERNNQKDENSVIICPVGPVGHYPYLVEEINQKKLDLKNTWFINMDEYLDFEDRWIEETNKLSFRGFMQREFYDQLSPELLMPEEQRVFPDPSNLTEIPNLIERLGKVDLAVGGIGINGHVAFNEPDRSLSEEEFLNQQTRILSIAPETRTTNAIGDLSGALEEMPMKCITIGIKEIYSANRILLACFRDWHKAVVRRASCGVPSSGFPATLLQKHPNIHLFITDFVADMG